MGLLLNDPMSMGLLSFGLRLMSTPGKFGPALGQAGMGALGDAQQAQDRQAQAKSRESLERMRALQEQMTILALAQAKQDQAKRQATEEAYRGAIVSPAQQALAGGGGPTVANAQAMEGLSPRVDQQRLIQGLMGADPMMAYQMMQPKPKKLMSVAPGATVLDEESGKPVYSAPPKEDLDALIIPGPDGKPMINPLALQAKQSIARAGASQQINYGQPIPAFNPQTGKPEFVRPDNRGGMTFTGVEPPPQNRDTKLPAELQRMQIAGDSMVKLMDSYEEMLKKHNPRDPMVQMNPTIRADMQALKRNIELQFKELQALGALAGPDIEIMRQSLADPFSTSGAYFGREGLLAQVKRAKDLVKIRSDAVLSTQGRGPDANPPDDNDPLGLRGK